MMSAVAHNPKFAKKVGIPQSVGEEFHEADKGVGKYMKPKKKMKKKGCSGMHDNCKYS